MTPEEARKSKDTPQEYKHILSRLDRVRRYLRAVIWVESVIHALVALLVVAPTVFLLDNWLHFSNPLRLGGFMLTIGLGLVVFLASARIVFQRWSYERLALRVERKFPDLNNRLINAVQLGSWRREDPGYAVVAAILDETVRETSMRHLRDAVNTRGLKRGLLVGVLLGGLVAAYAWFLPDHFKNAAMRILAPTSDVLPITYTKMHVRPGDTTVNKGASLAIEAEPSGQLPRKAAVEVYNQRNRSKFTMEFDGSRFVHTLGEISEPFRYRVRAADFVSKWYDVRVIEKPRIVRHAVRYEYPDYTRLSPAVVDPANGSITALEGTRAILMAWTNKPVERSQFQVDSGPVLEPTITPASQTDAGRQSEGSLLEVAFAIGKSGNYKWSLRDAEQFTNAPPPVYPIRATTDAAPRIAITSPRGNVEVHQGEDVNILFSGSDDYGLVRAALTMRKAQGDPRDVRELKFDPPRKTLNEGYVLKTSAFEIGDQIQFTAHAVDSRPGQPGRAASEAVAIKILPPEAKSGAASEALKNLLTELLKILESQIAVKKDTSMWRVSIEAKDVTSRQRRGVLKTILLAQSTVRMDTLAVLEIPDVQDRAWVEAREQLRALSENEMRQALKAIEILEKMDEAGKQRAQVDLVRGIQIEIEKQLRALIGDLSARFPSIAEAIPEEEGAADLDDDRLPPSTMADLHGSMLDFIKDQRDLVESLQKMENVAMDDLATTVPETLEDLAKKEEDWAEYFKDAANWLRSSPMVEDTESGLREELLEIYSEIEMLPQELRKEKVKIEVSLENAGVELAEEMTANLEKWLAEQPDYRQWIMENAPDDMEVPLAELPDELEDLIGDLIETAEQMSSDIEDMTSNWADSLDKGAGWEAADGPISNYSAQGVTGNIQPNDMDISGRSGEGRSGRSLGEMVESVATGKGGRDTQTRMTSDAMGEGVVEDLSTEQVKGVTGGGKIAGTTGYGLVSPNAPDQPELVQQMVSRQADLKMRAISLHKKLVKMNLPGTELEAAIRALDQSEMALRQGQYHNLRDLNAVVVGDLKDQQQIAREQFRVRRDRTGSGNKLQHNIQQGATEEFPEEYRSLLSAYYEALSSNPQAPGASPVSP